MKMIETVMQAKNSPWDVLLCQGYKNSSLMYHIHYVSAINSRP